MSTTATNFKSATSPSSPSPVDSSPPVDPNSVQLYINNLAFSTTPQQLTDWIAEKIGQPPTDVNIVTHKYTGRSKGFGFVRVPKENLSAALSLNGTSFGEREIGVVEAIERTEEEKAAARAKRDVTRKVRQAERKAAKAAAAAAATTTTTASVSSPTEVTESSLNFTRPSPARKEAKIIPADHTQLYVNNLSFTVNSDELAQLFAEKLKLDSPPDTDVVMTRANSKKSAEEGRQRSRGFGFVMVKNSDLDTALSLNGLVFQGREIGVVVARDREERQPRNESSKLNGEEGKEGTSQPPRKRNNRRFRRGPAQSQNQLNSGTTVGSDENANGGGNGTESGVDSGSRGGGNRKRRGRRGGGSYANNNNNNSSSATETVVDGRSSADGEIDPSAAPSSSSSRGASRDGRGRGGTGGRGGRGRGSSEPAGKELATAAAS